MRFPIYFFLLMSGIFYLTGNPFYNNDETGEPGAKNKVAQLKYGRHVNAPSEEKNAKVKQVTPAVVKREPSVEPSIADNGPETVDSGEDPVLLPSASNPAPAAAESFGNTKSMDAVDRMNKPLDWTVFGNKRKNASLTVPVRTRSQDEIDADGIDEEVRDESSSDRSSQASIAQKRKSAKAKRRKLRAQRAARKARAKRRLARLKRKNKAAYRVARKNKKKTSQKSVSKKPRRKFGFSNTVGRGGQLVGN